MKTSENPGQKFGSQCVWGRIARTGHSAIVVRHRRRSLQGCRRVRPLAVAVGAGSRTSEAAWPASAGDAGDIFLPSIRR
jgi:hypothetical protein